MTAPPGVCTRCGPSTAKGSPCSPSTTARIACGSSVMRDRERPTRCPCCHSTKRGGSLHRGIRPPMRRDLSALFPFLGPEGLFHRDLEASDDADHGTADLLTRRRADFAGAL